MAVGLPLGPVVGMLVGVPGIGVLAGMPGIAGLDGVPEAVGVADAAGVAFISATLVTLVHSSGRARSRRCIH